MRCHIHMEPDGTKILIPGCEGVAYHWHLPDKEALRYCSCPKKYKSKTKDGIIAEQDKIIRRMERQIIELRIKNKQLKDELHQKDN